MKSQIGDFLPLILSTIGGVLLNKLLGGGMTFPQVVGKGLQFPTSQGKGMQFIPNPYLVPYQMPQFYGNGYGKKKRHGKGLLPGKNSPLNGIPIIGDIF